MKLIKASVAVLALLGFAMTPMGPVAAEGKDPVKTVGCGIITIATAPIWIITGDKPKC